MRCHHLCLAAKNNQVPVHILIILVLKNLRKGKQEHLNTKYTELIFQVFTRLEKILRFK